MNPCCRVLRGLAMAGPGLWRKVRTIGPDVIYWFLAFVRRRHVEARTAAFLADLRSEAAAFH